MNLTKPENACNMNNGNQIFYNMRRYTLLTVVMLWAVVSVAQFKPHVTNATKVYNLDVLPYFDSDFGEFSEGLVLVRDSKSKNCAVFNDKGEALLHFGIPLVSSMRKLPKYHRGVIPAAINQNNKTFYLILDSKGQKVATLTGVTALAQNFSDGMITAFKSVPVNGARRNVFLRYYNTAGKEIYPALWQNVTNTYTTLQEPRPFSNGLSCYYDYKTRRYGYFSKEGKIVIPAKYVKAHDFSDGKAVVSPDGSSWIYIDTSGRQCIGMTFTAREPEDFHEGVAVVYQRDGNKIRPCYMNDKGEILTKPQETLSRFMNGYAWVNEAYVVDKSFKTVSTINGRLSPHQELIYDESDKTVQVGPDVHTLDGRLYFTNNNVVVKSFVNGLAPFRWNDKCGYLNKKGEIVLMFQLSKF